MNPQRLQLPLVALQDLKRPGVYSDTFWLCIACVAMLTLPQNSLPSPPLLPLPNTPNPINDRGMIQGITDNRIFLTQDNLSNFKEPSQTPVIYLKQAPVGIPARCVNNCVLGAMKMGNFFLQLFMNVLCATYEAHRR